MSGRGRFRHLQPKSIKNQRILAIARANTHLTAIELLEVVRVEFPAHTEGQLRMMIHHYDVPVKVNKRAWPTKKKGPAYAGKPTAPAAPAPVLGPLHTAIHSYHGRSRYLPAYYEL